MVTNHSPSIPKSHCGWHASQHLFYSKNNTFCWSSFLPKSYKVSKIEPGLSIIYLKSTKYLQLQCSQGYQLFTWNLQSTCNCNVARVVNYLPEIFIVSVMVPVQCYQLFTWNLQSILNGTMVANYLTEICRISAEKSELTFFKLRIQNICNGAMDVNYLPESYKVSVMVPGLSSIQLKSMYRESTK